MEAAAGPTRCFLRSAKAVACFAHLLHPSPADLLLGRLLDQFVELLRLQRCAETTATPTQQQY